MVEEPQKKRAVEEIAREFKIPLEEAEKRMENFMSGIPKTELSDEIRKKKAEAISKLPPPKKGTSALKISLSLDRSEEEDFLKLMSSMRAKTKADVFRRLFQEAVNLGSTKTTNEERLSPKIAQPIIRLKEGTELPHPTHYLEALSIDDLRAAAATLGVPIIELRSSSDGIVDLVAIDWSKDIGFFHRQSI